MFSVTEDTGPEESRFNLSYADGRICVWTRKGERYDNAKVIERDRFGGGGVMVWGRICHRGERELVTVAGNVISVRYCDRIIEPVVVAYLQQGNASCFNHVTLMF